MDDGHPQINSLHTIQNVTFHINWSGRHISFWDVSYCSISGEFGCLCKCSPKSVAALTKKVGLCFNLDHWLTGATA